MARKSAAPSKKSSPAKRGAASNGSSQPFGAALETRMRDKGISYRALAEKTGLSAGYLNHLVHGNRPVPANPVIQSIAKAVGVKADSFREFRIRKVSEALAKKPELVDKVYVDIVKGK
ncbi:MAG: Helix-turn-helix domain [Gaiellales bacterium]|jgi:transcriptional regulator with XRE-family HTH domain|nr:Helix-turn-helix domain [Gaiellales bacterium]